MKWEITSERERRLSSLFPALISRLSQGHTYVASQGILCHVRETGFENNHKRFQGWWSEQERFTLSIYTSETRRWGLMRKLIAFSCHRRSLSSKQSWYCVVAMLYQ
jgi:hypothetical protein